FEHLVVRAQYERAVAVSASPWRIASPSPVELVIDSLLPIRAHKIVGFDLAVQVESLADAAGHFRLPWIFRRKGVDVGLNVPIVPAIGGGGPPGMEIHAGGVSIQARRGGIGEGLDFLRSAPGYERESFRDLGRDGEVSRASV